MSEQLHEAITTLESATAKLKTVAEQGSYSVGELREIRSAILQTVRFNIDPLALGHAPERRHY